MESQSTQTIKIPILQPGEYDLWKMRMEQYLQCIDYTLWEIIENEKAQRKAELKARSTLLMALPNEHQLKFNSYKDAKTLMQAIKNRFGGNAATKKTQKNLLKQQYENFAASNTEVIEQTYERLQKLISATRAVSTAQKVLIPASTMVLLIDLQQIHPDDLEEMEFGRAPRELRPQNKEPTRRIVPVKETTSNALVSQCDGFGYD
ncbi:hypothetical protein Tco_0628369 [Tanacetum coccineum]|uniref:Uncharacterized protein n=1 Tax=Tanacetum coccineum TaxID=301880 RepID=A0ABQ4WQ44_9ASTR